MKKIIVLFIMVFLALSTSTFAKGGPKFIPDGGRTILTGVVTVSYTDATTQKNYCYIEQADRAWGMKIVTTELMTAGSLIRATGSMTTLENGERALSAVETGQTEVLGTGFPIVSPIYFNQKLLGGGKLGYTEGVSSSSSLNNIGHLVRISGNVTKSSPFEAQRYLTYLDDGSGLKSDLPNILGVKYYGSNSYTVGQKLILTGVVCCEKTSDGKIIPIIIEAPSQSSTVLGPQKATATIKIDGGISSSGKKIRIFSQSLGSEITLNNTGKGQLQTILPKGDYTIGCSGVGFKDQVQKLTVTSTGGEITFNLVFASIYIDIVSEKTKVAPGETVNLTAIVRDECGNRIPNISLIWSATPGAISESAIKTDLNGEAKAKLTTTTTHAVATIRIIAENVTGIGYVDATEEGDPYLRITAPTDNAQVSGIVTVKVACKDTNPDGSTDIVSKHLLIDGLQCGIFFDPNDEQSCVLNTTALKNGPRILTAVVTDRLGHTMISNSVMLNVYNQISEVKLNQRELFYDNNPQNFQLTGKMNTPGSWIVSVKDCRNSATVWSTTGSGPGAINASWNGIINGSYGQSLYRFEVETTGTSGMMMRTAGTTIQVPRYEVTIGSGNGKAFICAVVEGDDQATRDACYEEIIAVADACRAQYVPYTIILNPIWKSSTDEETGWVHHGLDYWLGEHDYEYFFITCHGGYIEDSDGVWRTYLSMADGEIVCGNNTWIEDEMLRNNTPAFTDLYIPDNQYKIVQINACNSAGDHTRNLDMNFALAFKIYGGDLYGGVYLGWKGLYKQLAVPGLWSLSPNGTGWTKSFWRRLGEGYTVFDAITLTDLYPYPNEDGWQKLYLSMTDIYSAYYMWLGDGIW